jgi:hypothetical protein
VRSAREIARMEMSGVHDVYRVAGCRLRVGDSRTGEAARLQLDDHRRRVHADSMLDGVAELVQDDARHESAEGLVGAAPGTPRRTRCSRLLATAAEDIAPDVVVVRRSPGAGPRRAALSPRLDPDREVLEGFVYIRGSSSAQNSRGLPALASRVW